MHLAGFAEYMNGAARCVRSGRHLLNMSNSELEKVDFIIFFIYFLEYIFAYFIKNFKGNWHSEPYASKGIQNFI